MKIKGFVSFCLGPASKVLSDCRTGDGDSCWAFGGRGIRVGGCIPSLEVLQPSYMLLMILVVTLLELKSLSSSLTEIYRK